MKRTLDGAFPSRFLTSTDIAGKNFTATIKSIDYEKMTDGKEKPVVFFDGMRKGVVLNKTKAKFLAQLAKSNKFDDWIGLEIHIREGVTSFKGDEVSCIKFENTSAQQKAAVKDALDDDLPDNLKGGEDEGDDDL